MHRTQGILLADADAVSVVVAIPPLLQESSGVARADGGCCRRTHRARRSRRCATASSGASRTPTSITAFNKLGGVFDQDFDPLLRKAQPGIQQQALEADRDNKKAAIERSYVRFVTPTGYDSTGIKGEYTYKNNEAILVGRAAGEEALLLLHGRGARRAPLEDLRRDSAHRRRGRWARRSRKR